MVAPIIDISITRDYLMTKRQALLLELEAIELLLHLSPRTSEIRKAAKPLTPPPQYQVELDIEREDRKVYGE